VTATIDRYARLHALTPAIGRRMVCGMNTSLLLVPFAAHRFGKNWFMGVTMTVAAIFAPMAARADCENLGGQTVIAGALRGGLAAGTGGVTAHVNAFNGGSSAELNIGANHTIGWLPAGEVFAIGYATATADSHPQVCVMFELGVDVNWYGQPNCEGLSNGMDTRSYVINTCGGAHVRWRSQNTIMFPGMGFAPSFKSTLAATVNHVQKAFEEGCFNISTDPSGCND
jgi:hypothetical protein